MKLLKYALLLALVMVVAASCAPKPGSLTINPDDVKLQSKGATAELKATVLDTKGKPMENQTVLWTSSDPNIAEVDSNGVVKAVGSGEATVTASVGTVSGTAKVKVKIVSAIEIQPAHAAVVVDEQAKFTAIVRDDKGNKIDDVFPTWSIGDSTIAQVTNKGTVTGKAVGTTTVTASVGPVSAKATVEVTKKDEKQIKKDEKKKPEEKTLKGPKAGKTLKTPGSEGKTLKKGKK